MNKTEKQGTRFTSLSVQSSPVSQAFDVKNIFFDYKSTENCFNLLLKEIL